MYTHCLSLNYPLPYWTCLFLFSHSLHNPSCLFFLYPLPINFLSLSHQVSLVALCRIRSVHVCEVSHSCCSPLIPSLRVLFSPSILFHINPCVQMSHCRFVVYMERDSLPSVPLLLHAFIRYEVSIARVCPYHCIPLV